MFQQVIIVMDARPTPKAEKRVKELVAANQCLCGCGRSQWKRGLARVCYYAWQTQRAGLKNAQERGAFDARLIRRGLLLIAQAVRAYRKSNVFAQVASEKTTEQVSGSAWSAWFPFVVVGRP